MNTTINITISAVRDVHMEQSRTTAITPPRLTAAETPVIVIIQYSSALPVLSPLGCTQQLFYYIVTLLFLF